MPSLYRRSKMDQLTPTDDHSRRYWRKQAREIFARYPDVNIVQVIHGGRKTDSEYLQVGRATTARPEVYVIVASTGGRWGKSRRDFPPPAHEEGSHG